MRQSAKEYIVYLIMAVVALLITCWLAYDGQPKPIGIALPTVKHTPPPTSVSQVKVYNALPINAKVLGRVSVEMHFKSQSKKDVDETLAYGKKLAASLGANGLVTEGIAYTTPGSTPASMEKYILRGQAVHVPQA